MEKIYLDNNATTPIDKNVLEAMLPFLEKHFGNPSSNHRFGETARSAIESAREKVASFIGADPGRIFFTGSGTEANNQAIWSAVTAHPHKKHIMASQVEHASVLSFLSFLLQSGYEVEFFPVGESGEIDLESLENSIREDTALVSFMAANNETGVIWPTSEIGEICRDSSTLFHCDAVQLAGKEQIEVEEMSVDYLTLSAHKMHGPKGIGALYARRTSPVAPLIIGGGQEKGMRSGTENVGAIVGFGAASEEAGNFLPNYHGTIGELRCHIEQKILEKFPDARINGYSQPRLANTVNISLKYLSAVAIIQDLDEQGFAVSAHSACHGGDLNPSHTLTAMNVPEEYIHGALRISLSKFTTSGQVDLFLEALFSAVAKNKQL